MEQLELWSLWIEMSMFVVALITMVLIIIAEFTKWRGLRDEEFEREHARLRSLIDRFQILSWRGQEREHRGGILVVDFSIGGLLDIIKRRNIRTIEELREVFGYKGEYNQFASLEHYFLSFRNLMKWVDKRRFRKTKCKYAQKIVASLSREEVILISCFCLIRFPLVSIAKEVKDYIEKYGMLYLLHTDARIDQKKGLELRKHFNESAFVERGSECG